MIKETDGHGAPPAIKHSENGISRIIELYNDVDVMRVYDKR